MLSKQFTLIYFAGHLAFTAGFLKLRYPEQLSAWQPVYNAMDAILSRLETAGVEFGNEMFLCLADVGTRNNFGARFLAGKLWIWEGKQNCHVADGEKIEKFDEGYQLLVHRPGIVSWVPYDGQIPKNIGLVFGGNLQDQTRVYVCRARYDNGLIVGHMYLQIGTCFIISDDKIVEIKPDEGDIEILAYGGINLHPYSQRFQII